MDQEWIGKSVSVSIPGLGDFQGLIHSVQLEDDTITLQNAFHNGKASTIPNITLGASDIQHLEFLDMDDAAANNVSPKKSVIQKRRKATRTNSESGGSGAGGAGGRNSRNGGARGMAAGIPMQQQQRRSPTKRHDSLAQQQQRSTPTNRRERDRAQNEDCFGGLDDHELTQEFDFEKNLALFDKRLVFEEIEDACANQPDVVRLVDSNLRRKPQQQQQQQQQATTQRQPAGRTTAAAAAAAASADTLHLQPQEPLEPKYRNDENVLASEPARFRQIDTGEPDVPGEYSTDLGLIVPAVTPELRRQLERSAEQAGVSQAVTTALVARAGAEMAMQLCGGEHRLNPQNRHQTPTVVVLCGVGQPAVYGLSTARFLAVQGLRTMLYLPDLPHYPPALRKELELYKRTGQKFTRSVKALPSSSVDLIVVALEDHQMWPQERDQPWLRQAQQWARDKRAPVLAVDPPSQPEEPVVPFKVCLTPGLPLWYPGPSTGKVYLVNPSWPKQVYEDVGVTYESPFGMKIFMAIYPNAEESAIA